MDSVGGPAATPCFPTANVLTLAAKDGRWTAKARRLGATGAFVETVGRPALGSQVALAHPEVGAIVADVQGHDLDGVRLTFETTAESAAFALAMTACGMTVSAT
ncbi:MAG: hypothetical protein WA906_07575 [Pacificimonas sp.]